MYNGSQSFNYGADAVLTFQSVREFYGPIGPRMVTAPDVQPLSLDLVKSHLRVQHTRDDELIEDIWIPAATAEAQKLRGEVFITQTWEIVMPRFPLGRLPIYLFPKPVQSISSITYIDENGEEQSYGTMSGSPEVADEYRLIRDPKRPKIALTNNEYWPTSVAAVQNAVTIQVVAGFGDDGADVPALCRAAMLMMCGHFNENREAVVTLGSAVELPLGIRFMLEVPKVG